MQNKKARPSKKHCRKVYIIANNAIEKTSKENDLSMNFHIFHCCYAKCIGIYRIKLFQFVIIINQNGYLKLYLKRK